MWGEGRGRRLGVGRRTGVRLAMDQRATLFPLRFPLQVTLCSATEDPHPLPAIWGILIQLLLKSWLLSLSAHFL